MWTKNELKNLFRGGARNAFSRFPVKPPLVERTFEAVANDLTPSSQIGSQMRAVGIRHVHLVVSGPEDGKIVSQSSHVLDLSTPNLKYTESW